MGANTNGAGAAKPLMDGWTVFCDYYNPEGHHGSMPVRVLQGNFLKWFEDISTDLRWEMEDLIKEQGLDAGIGYSIARHKIEKFARIHPLFDDDCKVVGHKIEVHEPVLQLLWCTSYALYVLYKEGYARPFSQGDESGVLNTSDPFVQKAQWVFFHGLQLREGFKPHHFYWIPNAEEVRKEDHEHIYKANGVCCAGVAFILAHELGHKSLKHVDRTVSAKARKECEFEADAFAAEWIKKGMGKSEEQDITNVFGVIAAMTVMMLLDHKLKGSHFHPPPDDRLRRVLAILDSETPNEVLWCTACFGLKLWTMAFPGIKIPPPTKHDSYKPIFEEMMAGIEKQVNKA